MGQSTSTGGSQMGYASEFKARAVQRHLSNGQQSIAKSALDIGVSKTALRVWLAVYNNPVMMAGMKESNKMRPQDWSSREKVRACFEFERLSLEEQGEFLRREGLHTETLEEWKRLCLEALSINGNQTASRSELNEATRKIKELERDLNRKNLALAETSALLILKKKADLLWGFEDNE
jgi:transposase-like protein